MRRRSTVGGALEMFSLPLPLVLSTLIQNVDFQLLIFILYPELLFNATQIEVVTSCFYFKKYVDRVLCKSLKEVL